MCIVFRVLCSESNSVGWEFKDTAVVRSGLGVPNRHVGTRTTVDTQCRVKLKFIGSRSNPPQLLHTLFFSSSSSHGMPTQLHIIIIFLFFFIFYFTLIYKNVASVIPLLSVSSNQTDRVEVAKKAKLF